MSEILKVAYISTFNLLWMLNIIHVSLMSSPVTGIREGRLMRNTRKNIFLRQIGINLEARMIKHETNDYFDIANGVKQNDPSSTPYFLYVL